MEGPVVVFWFLVVSAILWIIFGDFIKSNKKSTSSVKQKEETVNSNQLPVVTPDILPARRSILDSYGWNNTPTVISSPEPEAVLASHNPRIALKVLKTAQQGEFARITALQMAGVASQALLVNPQVREIEFNLKVSGGFKAKGKVRLR